MENLHRTLSKEIERGKERSEQQFSEGKTGRRRCRITKGPTEYRRQGKRESEQRPSNRSLEETESRDMEISL